MSANVQQMAARLLAEYGFRMVGNRVEYTTRCPFSGGYSTNVTAPDPLMAIERLMPMLRDEGYSARVRAIYAANN